MNVKKCPFIGGACEYHDCMLFNKAAAQCSISVIAVEMGSASGSASALADTLQEINGELPNIADALKGLV